MERVTIGKIIETLENAVFHYEILIDQPIDVDLTVDVLYGSKLEDFDGYETNSYNIYKKEDKYYLSITLKVNDVDLDKFGQMSVNIDNMNSCFSSDMICEDRLVIPNYFEHEVYIDDPRQCDGVDVKFKFAKVDSIELLSYIVMI